MPNPPLSSSETMDPSGNLQTTYGTSLILLSLKWCYLCNFQPRGSQSQEACLILGSAKKKNNFIFMHVCGHIYESVLIV